MKLKQAMVLKHNKPRPRVAHRSIARFLGIDRKCNQVVPQSLYTFPENFMQIGPAVFLLSCWQRNTQTKKQRNRSKTIPGPRYYRGRGNKIQLKLPLDLSAVVSAKFTSVLIHRLACPCGSMKSGQRREYWTMIPFSTLRLSLGRPAICQLRIFTGSLRVSVSRQCSLCGTPISSHFSTQLCTIDIRYSPWIHAQAYMYFTVELALPISLSLRL